MYLGREDARNGAGTRRARMWTRAMAVCCVRLGHAALVFILAWYHAQHLDSRDAGSVVTKLLDHISDVILVVMI